MTDKEKEDLMYAPLEDQIFWLKGVEGLPQLQGKNGDGIGSDGIKLPYGCGPHCVAGMREIARIVKPKHILEIGFNMGYSSATWLALLPDAKLMSCDISYKDETILAAKIITARNDGRFLYYNRNSDSFINYIHNFEFDFCFIDGGHLLENVIEDVNLCIALKVPFIAFDDIIPDFGRVKEAIDTFGEQLEFIYINGNIALYKNTAV